MLVAVGIALVLGDCGSASTETTEAPKPSKQPSYTLNDFEITYPFEGESRVAGIAFGASWASDSYPGEASCVITLSNEQGEIVGTHRLTFSSEKPAVPPMAPQPVEVTGEPKSAEGSCGPGDPLTDAEKASDYTFGEPRISEPRHGDEKAEIKFEVGWTTDVDPVEELCSAEIELNNGQIVTEGPWEFSAPRGQDLTVHTDAGAPEEIKDASVRCNESNS